MSDPKLRELVLGWYETGLRWAVVSLHEDGRWHFYRDCAGLTCGRHEIRLWIDLPPPPRFCTVSDEDMARAAGTRLSDSADPSLPEGK